MQYWIRCDKGPHPHPSHTERDSAITGDDKGRFHNRFVVTYYMNLCQQLWNRWRRADGHQELQAGAFWNKEFSWDRSGWWLGYVYKGNSARMPPYFPIQQRDTVKKSPVSGKAKGLDPQLSGTSMKTDLGELFPLIICFGSRQSALVMECGSRSIQTSRWAVRPCINAVKVE